VDTATYDQMTRAQDRYHEQAMTIPGVHGTSIGQKDIAGETTPSLAIVVHVEKKRPLEDLPVSDRIPTSIDGFPTDVIEHDPPRPIAQHVMGGANLWVNNFYGTLGCIVRDSSDQKTCLLSNEHVLSTVGTKVYVDKNDTCHFLGYTKRVKNNGTVDAGIASLEVGSEPSIANIGKVTGTRILTWEDVGHLTVRKMGRTTQVTYGKVNQLSYQGRDAQGNFFSRQVYIKATSPSDKFCDFGDSGSVIVDDKVAVVALLSHKDNVGGGIGGRIENVESELDIKVLTAITADPPLPYAETFEGRLEALCDQSGRTREYFQTYLQSRAEVQHLFHDTARLYATWQKIPQDAFMDAFRSGVKDPDSIIPASLDGQDTIRVLTQLRDSMSRSLDPRLMEQVDALAADLTNSIGRSWRQAIAERANAAGIPSGAPAGG